VQRRKTTGIQELIGSYCEPSIVEELRAESGMQHLLLQDFGQVATRT